MGEKNFPKHFILGSGAGWRSCPVGLAGDPFGKLRAGSSLRLKNGYAQDDAGVPKTELPHCLTVSLVQRQGRA